MRNFFKKGKKEEEPLSPEEKLEIEDSEDSLKLKRLQAALDGIMEKVDAIYERDGLAVLRMNDIDKQRKEITEIENSFNLSEDEDADLRIKARPLFEQTRKEVYGKWKEFSDFYEEIIKFDENQDFRSEITREDPERAKRLTLEVKARKVESLAFEVETSKDITEDTAKELQEQKIEPAKKDLERQFAELKEAEKLAKIAEQQKREDELKGKLETELGNILEEESKEPKE